MNSSSVLTTSQVTWDVGKTLEEYVLQPLNT